MSRSAVWWLVLAVAGLPSRVVWPCGPEFPLTHFVWMEDRIADLACGPMGVLTSTFGTASLAVAYRRVASGGESPAWQAALQAGPCRPDDGAAAPPSAQSAWLEARRAVPEVPAVSWFDTGRSIERRGPEGMFYVSYDNCLDDAFRTATRTLSERSSRFGAGSPEVRAWVTAQDAVFANCPGDVTDVEGPPPVHLPPPVESGGEPLLAQDRAYQTAAAYFYAGQWDEAERRFRAIAADAASPWHEIAAHVALRVLIRRALIGSATGQTDRAALEAAQRALAAAVDDGQPPAIRSADAGLLQWVDGKLAPLQRVNALATALLGAEPPPDVAQKLTDLYLLNRWHGQLPTRALAPEARALMDWLHAVQGAAVHPPAPARWKRLNGGTPWLLAALVEAAGTAPGSRRLAAAAASLPADAPAYASAAFHGARLLLEAGRRDAARTRADAALAQLPAGLDRSSHNLLAGIRLAAAADFTDFLHHAALVPVGSVIVPYEAEAQWKDATWFPAEAAQVLTQETPLALLTMATADAALPPHLQREVALAAWVRAVLLDDVARAQRLAERVIALAPELRADLSAWQRAGGGTARRFAGAFAILRAPGLRPWVSPGVGRLLRLDELSDLRDNWWCKLVPPGAGPTWGNYYLLEAEARAVPEEVLHGRIDVGAALAAPDREAGRAEWSKLRALPTAPNWLAQAVLPWAETHRKDPRVPEALHLVVRATRFGCTDDGTGELSERAFRLLHRAFPRSEWTRKTPYWFN